MKYFNNLVGILFKTSCENSENKPHSDGLEMMKNLGEFLSRFDIEYYLQEYNKEYDGKIYKHANMIARKKDSSGPYIAIQGHIDTVPCNEEYKYEIVDNKIIGRGAVDMKGPLIGAISSFIKSIEEGRYNVLLIITDDEETDFAGITKLMADRETILPQIDFCINVEPTELKPSFLIRGFGQYEFFANGGTGHSSSSKNDFLIEKMIPLINSVKEYLDKSREISDPVYGETRSALTMITAGVKTNQLPDSFYMVFNMRTVTNDSDVYKKLFDEIVRNKCDDSIRIKELFFEPSKSLINEDVRVKIRNVYSKKGIEYSEYIMHAFTEAYMFNNAGIPCFSWGPGSLDLAHVDPKDEIIEIGDIELFSEMLSDFLLEL